MSTRKLTDIQFSQGHAIDGTRLQSAVDDVYSKFNDIPLEYLDKKHTLQTLVLKASGRTVQTLTALASGTLVGTDRPEAPFIDHAMLDTDVGATAAIFRAKGIPEATEGHSFVWTASTSFLRPITLDSVSVHIDACDESPFSPAVYLITFTGAHGLSDGDLIETLTNNAHPSGVVGQFFRVIDVVSTTQARIIWYATLPANLPTPGLAFDPASALTVKEPAAAATLTASAVVEDMNAQALRILVDCPYLQYSTDRRLNSKVFARQNFLERTYSHPRLSNISAPLVDMYPVAFPTPGLTGGFEGIYYEAEDLNIALPSAQTVNIRLAFGHETFPYCFPSSVSRVTYTIAYREQILA